MGVYQRAGSRPGYWTGVWPFSDAAPFDAEESRKAQAAQEWSANMHRLADQIQAELEPSYPILGCPRWLAEERAIYRLARERE